MAKTYSYDDFLRAMEQSGLGGQFSQADLNLAKQNPDAGMSLLSYKTDYANATTPEARALANQGAEGIRSSYGGYTGGGDGGSFKLDPMSPRQFEYGDAPTFTDRYDDAIQAAYERSANREPYSYAGAAPEYNNRYDPQIQQTISDILGRGEFTYDPKTDPVYSSYQKQYTREGQRATADALGQAAAATGGMPSSYAVTAATQAGDYYGAKMADKIPELYRDAYNRYLQEYQMKLSDLSALRGLESDDYAKYRDQLSQYNTDRSFDYSTWLDQQNLAQQDLANLRALRSDDLDMYKTNLGQYNTDRTFNYGQWLDEISNQRTQREDQRNWAQQAAQYEDYSLLNALGINTDQAKYNNDLARAMQAAEAGDYSRLAALGIDTSNAQQMQALEQAYKQAQIANVYANMDTEEDRALERAYRQAQIANVYANMTTDEERELEKAYRQAQIASVYAGMPTETERALEQQYKQAQIEKLLRGDTTSSGSTTAGTGSLSEDEFAFFDSLTNAQKLTYAKAAHNMGDDRYYARMGMIVQDGGSGSTGTTGGLPTVTTGNIRSLLATIKQAKEAGDPDVKTYDDALAQIEMLPGYDEATMGKQVKEYLKRLYQGKNVSGISGTKISQN